ncbi:hypothetical protein PFICI_01604 [Pestalotiopsis fici W106-1]|uniref:Xylanolytic transcriptional activator regulatory domain-containing protein n=1 Tax=Pestalotiopsis fici (strain W106-1 / CGMCC3.15140) TaxID=1229662 RepID=W3XRE5_PESFW|nr:uncharacterized protein PFICI_01604 [Pestalotiopsis fici W106-1]ETS87776.1 hypothetical protein PFICI_01604 [Pestalotiopsis fici W106-1]
MCLDLIRIADRRFPEIVTTSHTGTAQRCRTATVALTPQLDIDHNEECIFPEKRSRTRKRKEREQEMESRLLQMERLLHAATQGTLTNLSFMGAPSANSPATAFSSSSRNQWPQNDDRRTSCDVVADLADYVARNASPMEQDPLESLLTSSPTDIPVIFSDPTPIDPTLEHQNNASRPTTVGASDPHTLSCPNALQLPASPPISATTNDNSFPSAVTDAYPSCLQWEDTRPAESDMQLNPNADSSHQSKRRATQKSPQTTDNDETTCPSYLSICTFPAVEWVSQQSGMSDFLVSVRQLSTAINREKRLDKLIDPVRAPDPDLDTALRWTNAYFDHCLDPIFEYVNRSDFEARLRNHFTHGEGPSRNNGWYAMRNTIYASGCRYVICEARSPEAFSESRTQSWKYLENALSVHTELLYGPTSLDSIQALLLMAFHAEALGTPALEFTLLSNATRLAQSRGLHLRTPSGTCVPSEDDSTRQALWWSLYSYEKHLAYRSGIPSSIDDDYVNCPLPSSAGSSSPIFAEFLAKTVAQAQISSTVSKTLNSAKAQTEPAEKTLFNVEELSKRLGLWKESLSPVYQTQAPFKFSNLAPGMQIYHVLFLHFCYHVLVIAINGTFCYPWVRPDLHTNHSPAIREQIQKSTTAVAESSRQIILAVQRLEITSTLPVWLTFYFPLVGLINLFVCIIKDPLAPTAASDLLLLDLVVGHFGYLEWMSSSELNLAFPREVASYARDLVNKAKHKTPSSQQASCTKPNGQSQEEQNLDMVSIDALIGLEDWCTFLPPMQQTSSTLDDGFKATEADKVV